MKFFVNDRSQICILCTLVRIAAVKSHTDVPYVQAQALSLFMSGNSHHMLGAI